jgi:hypothetical protein
VDRLDPGRIRLRHDDGKRVARESTGFSTTPRMRAAGTVVFADMSTSAGAPFVICVASADELPNEYLLPESICGSTVVIDDPQRR